MHQDTPLQGRRILVVEDDFLVAQALAAILEEAGAVVVGPIGWADEALAFIGQNANAFNGAVVDVDLHGEKSYTIADALAKMGVRFVFATGYGAEAVDPEYRGFPRCEKPFNGPALIQALVSGSN
jgi:ActR/RegA family two-component response regulator